MKTALFIDEGRAAVILTPENEWEARALSAIAKEGAKVEIKEGQFNWTQGEYVRWFPEDLGPYQRESSRQKQSIFLTLGNDDQGTES